MNCVSARVTFENVPVQLSTTPVGSRRIKKAARLLVRWPPQDLFIDHISIMLRMFLNH